MNSENMDYPGVTGGLTQRKLRCENMSFKSTNSRQARMMVNTGLYVHVVNFATPHQRLAPEYRLK